MAIGDPRAMNLELVELAADFDRSRLLELFRAADDSEVAIASYIAEGRVFALRDHEAIVGHVQVIARDDREIELSSLAIVPILRGRGHGRSMLERVLGVLAGEGVRRVWVATASADIDNLAFYQKLGFRMHSIERDAFTVADGYPQNVRDRVWFDLELPPR
jgi:ribosomal protein S18 acetylase RimI-like enzyme